MKFGIKVQRCVSYTIWHLSSVMLLDSWVYYLKIFGPWGGYWFFLAWYILIYFIDAKTNKTFTAEKIFIHTFLLGAWASVELVLSIDFAGPLWTYY